MSGRFGRLALGAMALTLVALGMQPGRASTSQGIGAQLVLGNLSTSDSFTFAPDGRIFWGARVSGNIHLYDPDTGSDTIFFTIPNLQHTFDQGLLGLALHPNYPATPIVYAYATRVDHGELHNEIVTMRDAGGVGTGFRVVFVTNTIAATAHQGGRIEFGPDGMLYAMVGDGENAGSAQNTDLTSGKILRLTDRGKPAPGNPFRTPIFAYGFRNGFGFDFDPQTGLLWDTDNGPACNDEIDLVQSGLNYGWGSHGNCTQPPEPPANTNQDGPNPVFPLAYYTPPIAVTGAAFCSGCGLPDSDGTLFVGAFNTGELRRYVLTPDRLGIASEEVVYTHGGAIIGLEQAPDGTLYFSTGDGIWRLISV